METGETPCRLRLYEGGGLRSDEPAESGGHVERAARSSRGQCDITSLVVHDIFGGEILAADVLREGERVEAHMWNRLPGGLELDLTRDQFRNGEEIGEASVRRRPEQFDPEHPRYHRYEAYLVLAQRVQARLSGLS